MATSCTTPTGMALVGARVGEEVGVGVRPTGRRRRSIDNARSDEGQYVQNTPDSAIELEGFSGDSSFVFNR